MRKIILGLSAVAFAAFAVPAMADEAADPLGLKITGNVAGVSDYRFRGFSQSSEDPAVQGGITVTHDSGLYAGVWGSSISFAGNTEFDLYAGYSTEVMPGLTVDAGLLYYLYPERGSAANTDFFEPYVNLIGTFGPATVKVGVNYAWDQAALGDVSSVYVHAEPSIAIPNTPFGLNAHIGWAKSDSFLGGYDGNGEVVDYSVGGTATWKNLTFGVSYVNTDQDKPLKETTGADGAVVFSLTATF
jgi:uncharacterized protein (TIGR02001 family)